MAVWASCAADYRLGWELDTGRVEQGDANMVWPREAWSAEVRSSRLRDGVILTGPTRCRKGRAGGSKQQV